MHILVIKLNECGTLNVLLYQQPVVPQDLLLQIQKKVSSDNTRHSLNRLSAKTALLEVTQIEREVLQSET